MLKKFVDIETISNFAAVHYTVWHDITIPLTNTIEPMTADQAAAYNNLKTAFPAMEAAFK